MPSFPFVRHIEQHDELASTNDRAIAFARNPDAVTPALILAARQTAGRGRGGNRWWSSEGALTFSMVLDAANPLGTDEQNCRATIITPSDSPLLSLATAQAVCETAQHYATDGKWHVKPPNDVVLDDDGAMKKVAGILIEAPTALPPAPRRIVVGIGINVNNSFASAPPEVQAVGISLCEASGVMLDTDAVLGRVLENFAARLREILTSAVATQGDVPS